MEQERFDGDPPLRRFSRDPIDLSKYGSDWTKCLDAEPALVVFPESIDEVQALVRWARDRSLELVPSGGRTGLSGGAVALHGQVVVSTERMNRILNFDSVDRTLTVEAGVITQVVQDAARERGLFYPVDFASRGSSHIGGNIATNAGGIRVLRYGLTRNWVCGLKVVTGSGAVLDLNKGLTKNATGYDLRHLMIGSEGTLGIIVEATLQLTSQPRKQQVMLLALPRLSAVMEVFSSLRGSLSLSAFEFFTERALVHVVASGARRPFAEEAPYYVLAEFDADEAAAVQAFAAGIEGGTVLDAVLAQSDREVAEIWRLREGISESLAQYRPYKNDIAVRVAAVPDFLRRVDALLLSEYPGFEVVWFGHVGDGNLHISILPPKGWSNEAFVVECDRVTHQLGALLNEFGGSVSAEHGVGLLKRAYLKYSRDESEIDLMQKLRRVFDPDGVLNPGKLV